MPTRSTNINNYTIAETAQILKMSEEEVMFWAEIGLIPSRRAKGQVRISAKWVDNYRPTAEAIGGLGTGLTSEELVQEIRLGRRTWTWPLSVPPSQE